MNTNFEFLMVDQEDGIAIVTINREDKLNALNAQVITELKQCFSELEVDKAVKGIIITGKGEKAFIAGADIGAMSAMSPEQGKRFAELGQEVTLQIENCSKPVIAGVNGYALGGGCEFALSADFIYATKNAVFALPEVTLGLIPGFGGTQRLGKIIGRNRAKEMIYTGKNIDADLAFNMGLVVKLTDTKEQLIDECKKTLLKIMKNSPYAISQVKTVINQGIDTPTENGLKIESTTFGAIFSSYDMKEGTNAFIQKRKPQFKGE